MEGVASKASIQALREDDVAVQLERRRFTVSEYLRMAEIGIFAPDEKLELIDGEIVKKMSPIGTPHLWCVARIAKLLERRLGDQHFILVQSPLQLDEHNEPEPDIVLLPLREGVERPTAREALLVVEVSDTTIKLDRKVKVPLYAAFGIVEVWLVDLVANRIEAYREPKDGTYHQVLMFDETERLSPLKFPDVSFSVAEILGTKPLRLP
ncbi:MAG: Uma2 family endonuclease [Chloroherpetonaceae bacterium]|nr:Uma2 family endonuclease [Chloroherpetonaceae bacterium]MDW8465889.1 Uma2 family endonuclease [Chloroherpetonaceae bacterium]